MFTKFSGLLMFAAMMTISWSLVSADNLPSGCLPDFAECDTQHSELCESRYCNADRVCRPFNSTFNDSETKDFCADNPCPYGQICTYNVVQCIRAPCGPVMGCVKKSKTPCPT